MSSAGHILDMIARIRQNKSLRKRKKFKGDNRENSYSEKFATATQYDFPTVSEEEIERLKVQIRGNARAHHRKSLYVLVIMILIAAVLVWALIRYYKLSY